MQNADLDTPLVWVDDRSENARVLLFLVRDLLDRDDLVDYFSRELLEDVLLDDHFIRNVHAENMTSLSGFSSLLQHGFLAITRKLYEIVQVDIDFI